MAIGIPEYNYYGLNTEDTCEIRVDGPDFVAYNEEEKIIEVVPEITIDESSTLQTVEADLEEILGTHTIEVTLYEDMTQLETIYQFELTVGQGQFDHLQLLEDNKP